MASRGTISASELKAKCLRVLDDVSQGASFVVTKRGKLVARLVPPGKVGTGTRGAWKGHGRIRGDIVHVDWTREFGASR
jgi:prevent-host-death family protein